MGEALTVVEVLTVVGVSARFCVEVLPFETAIDGDVKVTYPFADAVTVTLLELPENCIASVYDPLLPVVTGIPPALQPFVVVQLTVTPEIAFPVTLSVIAPVMVEFPSVNVFCACDALPLAVRKNRMFRS